jgi:hypothetical protein
MTHLLHCRVQFGYYTAYWLADYGHFCTAFLGFILFLFCVIFCCFVRVYMKKLTPVINILGFAYCTRNLVLVLVEWRALVLATQLTSALQLIFGCICIVLQKKSHIYINSLCLADSTLYQWIPMHCSNTAEVTNQNVFLLDVIRFTAL